MIQETVAAKCEVGFPLEKGDAGVVEKLGIQGSSLDATSITKCQRQWQRVHRVGRWLPP